MGIDDKNRELGDKWRDMDTPGKSMKTLFNPVGANDAQRKYSTYDDDSNLDFSSCSLLV